MIRFWLGTISPITAKWYAIDLVQRMYFLVKQLFLGTICNYKWRSITRAKEEHKEAFSRACQYWATIPSFPRWEEALGETEAKIHLLTIPFKRV